MSAHCVESLTCGNSVSWQKIVMASVALELHHRGILITGDTFGLRGALRGLSGRWDATMRGWLFPMDCKARLVEALRARDDVANVKDLAVVTLELGSCKKGLLLKGQTFPIKEHLKAMSGRWDEELCGWVFPADRRAAIQASLPSLMKLEEPPSWTQTKGAGKPLPSPRCVSQPSVLVVESPTEPPTTAIVPYRKVATPHPDNSSTERDKVSCTTIVARAKPNGHTQHLVVAGGPHKLTEKVLTRRMVKKGPAGSIVTTATEKREREVACRHTGAKVETQTVTRKRKVTETKDEIIETATVIVKRVRKK